jgi:hypothetical protein
MIDLSPQCEPADLIDALYEARRENRRDLTNAVVSLLRHDDAMVREEAVSLLLAKWEIHELRDVARQMLQHDDHGVRVRAALGLASIATRDTREEDATLLATVFGERRSSFELQCACVEALSLMVGRSFVAERDDIGPKAVQDLLVEIAALRP